MSKASDPLAPLRVRIRDTIERGDWAAQKFVWIPDEREGFAAARVKAENGENATCVREESKMEVTVPLSLVCRMNPPKFDKSEDMASLTSLNEATVLFNIKDRYLADLIYTYSGLFCVVVNPYKMLPIYSDAVVQEYRNRKRDALPPHVYAVAEEAYRSLVEDNEDQSILCTGESGAGKTENTKRVIQYLATIAGRKLGRTAGHTATSGPKPELESQLLQANPILETFGNASTTKNDNSSRFGKFIRIQFDSSGYISGAAIDVYLLEKSRCVRQSEGERNFHAFYQLLAGAPADYRASLLLEATGSYKYLSNGDRKLPNVDDAREFEATNHALAVMGLTPAETQAVWRVVSSCLLFGQMEFETERRSDQATLKSDQPAQKLCQLLGINHVGAFITGLLKPKFDTKSGASVESITRQQTRDQVLSSTESLAKGMYERLFLWLVQKINQALGLNARDAKWFIGLLDIAGFEIFKVNSFEQLCINFTNEKLQQLFNHKMFIMEQEEYLRERIEWKFQDFGLNLQPTIDLIEQNPGVLAILDDASIQLRGDAALLENLTKLSTLAEQRGETKDKNKFVKCGLKDGGDFKIVHYAGLVTYTVANWTVKNKDPMNANITNLLEQSSDPFIKKLWQSEITLTGGVRARSSMRTVALIYKEQLSTLMFTLSNTNTHFVRCIIPNHAKRAAFIDSPLVLDQLACNGVLEGIRICRQGYPNRILFTEFRQRYKILCPSVVPSGFIEGRKACELMVGALDIPRESYQLGESKIFFRALAIHALEERRDIVISKIVVGLQSYCRRFLVRRSMINVSPEAIKVIQRNVRTFMRIRTWEWWRLYTKIKPLIPVGSTDQKLRELNAEVESLRKALEAEQRMRAEVEAERSVLDNERRVLLEQAKMNEAAALEAQSLVARLTQKRQEFEDENMKLEAELEQQLLAAQQLLGDKNELVHEVAHLKETLKSSDAVQARMNQLAAEVKEWRAKFEAAASELHATSEHVKRAQRDAQAMQEQLDSATMARTKLEVARKKAAAEMEDLQVQLASERQASTQLHTKQKGHDKVNQEMRAALEAANAELERTQAELRETQSKVLVLRNDVADMELRATAAETSKKKLEAELEELIQSQQDRNVADLERVRRELTATVEEQKKQILELEDDLQLATEGRMRSEVLVGTLKAELLQAREAQDAAATEALERRVRTLQQKITELQDEADSERRLRGKIANDKRKQDGELASLQDALAEEKKAREREQKQREAAERKLAELTAGDASGVLQASDVRELERLRTRVKQYRADMDDLEAANGTMSAGKRRAERALEEQSDLVTTYEKEIVELKANLRRIMSSIQSGDRGQVSLKWTTTEVTRGKGDASVHTESGTGVPHSLDDTHA